jgi:VIT1/CCC1 family predicted Fe2+/Mn2+ transporter
VPLAPYFVLRSTGAALVVSVLTTLLALLVFGYVKGTFPQRLADGIRWGVGGGGCVRDAKLIA